MSVANKIIAVSHATKRSLMKYYDIPSNKIHVIHNGIRCDLYKFSKREIEKLRKSLCGENEKLIFCPVARINEPRKGVKYLLEALQVVFSKSNAICVITGSGRSDVFNRYLERLPKKRVIFLGFVDEFTKRKLYSASDVVVLPSLLEGCPISILEALAAGAAIVATRVGGIPELVKDGRNGFLVDPTSPSELAEAILTIISDDELSYKIKIANYNDALRRFNWRKTAMLTEEVYKTVLERQL